MKMESFIKWVEVAGIWLIAIALIIKLFAG